MTTDATTTTNTPPATPATAQDNTVDVKGLRRIGYMLVGFTAFAGAMATYVSVTDQDIRSEFNRTTYATQPVQKPAAKTHTVKVSSTQFGC